MTRFSQTTWPATWASASAAHDASFSTYTGSPQRSLSSARSGTFRSGRLTLWRTLPVAASTTDGSPTATARADSPRWRSISA